MTFSSKLLRSIKASIPLAFVTLASVPAQALEISGDPRFVTNTLRFNSGGGNYLGDGYCNLIMAYNLDGYDDPELLSVESPTQRWRKSLNNDGRAIVVLQRISTGMLIGVEFMIYGKFSVGQQFRLPPQAKDSNPVATSNVILTFTEADIAKGNGDFSSKCVE
ncbi:MAG: hypothetical protein AB8B49_09570 [Nitratireductor sp.]